MAESQIWDSPGGYLEFMPPCTCKHPVSAHERNSRGELRRCSVWDGHPVGPCECRKYTQGDPKDFPPIPPTQPGLF